MSDAVRRHPLAGRLVEGARVELTARWRDHATGLEAKARADAYRADLATLIDLKSTADARAESFRKSVANYGYHRQNAFYVDGFSACGAPVENFVFVCVEKRAPFLVALYTLDEAAVTRGLVTIREDLETLAECIEEDRWDGLEEAIRVLDLPPWA